MKLSTPVQCGKYPFEVGLGNRIMLLGSCFSDELGSVMERSGMQCCVNPFGTLYNPVSLFRALERIQGGCHFTEADCVQMGSGSQLVCSFSHHTSFARPRAEEFLLAANEALDRAGEFWRSCDTLIVTTGTSWVWEHSGKVVANCLKRDAREFVHRPLSPEEVGSALKGILALAGGRRVIWTVSPIRHLWNGAHSNSLSKATLLLATDQVCNSPRSVYFPAFEIMLDELRDYRFYGEDMTHPTATAVGCVWERFCEAFVPAGELETMARNRKASRLAAHRPLH